MTEGIKLERISEKMERPEILLGSTYKIKPLGFDHAFYITINDIVLNAETEHEKRVPIEIFINTKESINYQWITAITTLISSVFRTGSNIKYAINQLKLICDPAGDVREKGGKVYPSMVSRIAHLIEEHLKEIGTIK